MVRFLLGITALIAAGAVLLAEQRNGGEAKTKTTTFTWCGLQVDVPEPLWVAPAGDPENPVLQIWDAEADSRIPTIMDLSGEVSAPKLDGSAPVEGVALSAKAQGVADSLRHVGNIGWPWVEDTAGTEVLERRDGAKERIPHPEAGISGFSVGGSAGIGISTCASELMVFPDGTRADRVVPAEREAFERWAAEVTLPAMQE